MVKNFGDELPPIVKYLCGEVGVRTLAFVVKLARDDVTERVGREPEREGRRPSIVLYLVGKWLLKDLPRFTDSRFSDLEMRPLTVPIL